MADELYEVKDNKDKFETTSRQFQHAENLTQTVTVVGKFDDLVNNAPALGDRASDYGENLFNYYVQNVSIARSDSEMGEMTLTCVKVSSPSEPFAITVEVDLQQLNTKLINHPNLQKNDTRAQIRCWLLTDEAQRMDKDGKPQSSYDFSTMSPTSSGFKKLTDDDAIKFAKAFYNGIEEFSQYLPVIRRTSSYIKLPGITKDDETHEISGQLSFPNSDGKVGEYCEPPITMPEYAEGKWFKSQDRLAQMANGSWQRQEEWTYTNDLRFLWIYEDGSSKAVIQDDSKGAK